MEISGNVAIPSKNLAYKRQAVGIWIVAKYSLLARVALLIGTLAAIWPRERLHLTSLVIVLSSADPLEGPTL